MHGLAFQGQTVARVLAELAARRATVPVFNAARLLHRVPGGWFVYDADPWAPQQVMLFVGPTPQQPPASPPVSASSPVPSPSPTAGTKSARRWQAGPARHPHRREVETFTSGPLAFTLWPGSWSLRMRRS